jgi:hypothetical protein
MTSQTFTSPGSNSLTLSTDQTVVIECWGAGGGSGGDSDTDTGGGGGTGGYIKVEYDGSDGETLDILVGGQGGDGGDGVTTAGGGGAGDGQGWFAGGDGADGSFDQGGGGGGGSASAVFTSSGTLIGTGEAGGGGAGANDSDQTGQGVGGGGGSRGGGGGSGFRDGEDATGTGTGGGGGNGSSGDGADGGDGGTDTGNAAGTIRTVTEGGGNDGNGQVKITEPDVVSPPETAVTIETPAPSATGSGSATLSAPTTLVPAVTPTPQIAGAVANAPLTAVSVSAPAPTAGGDGSSQVAPPTTTVAVLTPAPTLGVDAWLVDGEFIGQVTSESRTPRTLTLTTRVQSSVLTSVLRSLKTDEGQVDVLPTDDGGFVAVDRADGANTFSVTPPIRRQDLRQSGDYHVDRYEEDLVSQTVNEFDVELDLIADTNRTDMPSIDQDPLRGAAFDLTFDQTFTDNAEWAFETRYGQIVTNRVDAEFLGTGEGGVERFKLTARLTFEQARVLEAAVSLLNATRIREIPDATNIAVDDTDNTANTLKIDAPGGQSVVSDGDYIVTEWESTRLSEAYQSVTMTIAQN